MLVSPPPNSPPRALAKRRLLMSPVNRLERRRARRSHRASQGTRRKIASQAVEIGPAPVVKPTPPPAAAE
jgi:hypothetical protein